jgi:hypothetical protein
VIGWMFHLHRQADDLTRPATPSSPRGALVAQWQGRVSAIDWLHDLVSSGSAIHLGGDGYPFCMTARAGAVIPVVRDGPPHVNEPWVRALHDIVDEGWAGRSVYNDEVADACSDHEWLVVTIWDES